MQVEIGRRAGQPTRSTLASTRSLFQTVSGLSEVLLNAIQMISLDFDEVALHGATGTALRF